ncbi:MAG: hypothetical protein EOP62_13125 [Sphingomonadales bacterium]|nr:MAG: hypothetical protein EOP62_13125 [Sphingomonadales bacterium]
MIDRRTVLALTAWMATGGARHPGSRTPRSTDFNIVHDDETDNTAALHAMSAELAKQNIRELIWAKGIVRCRRPFIVPDRLRIVSDDDFSGIRNVAEGPDNIRSPLLIGNWHPAFLAHQGAAFGSDVGGGGRLALLPTHAGVDAAADRITLADPAMAAAIRVGRVHAVIRREYDVQSSTGVALQIPLASSLVRVVAADSRTGVVQFDAPIGFTSPGSIALVSIDAAMHDPFGLPVGFADNVSIEGLKTFGFTSIGNVCASSFECSFREMGGEVVTPIMVNSLTRSVIDGWRGTFTGARAVEIKFSHHEGVIRNIDLKHRPIDGQRYEGAMFSVGEYCRDLTVDTFNVDARQWNQGILFQLQPGQNCTFRNGRVSAPLARKDPVTLYADPFVPLRRSGLDKVTIRHGSNVHIYIAEGRHEAEQCFVRNCTFSTSYEGPVIAVAIRGGRECQVTGNAFDRGAMELSGFSSRGNLLRENITDSSTVRGVGIAQNRVGRNYIRGGGGTRIAFGSD